MRKGADDEEEVSGAAVLVELDELDGANAELTDEADDVDDNAAALLDEENEEEVADEEELVLEVEVDVELELGLVVDEPELRDGEDDVGVDVGKEEVEVEDDDEKGDDREDESEDDDEKGDDREDESEDDDEKGDDREDESEDDDEKGDDREDESEDDDEKGDDREDETDDGAVVAPTRTAEKARSRTKMARSSPGRGSSQRSRAQQGDAVILLTQPTKESTADALMYNVQYGGRRCRRRLSCELERGGSAAWSWQQHGQSRVCVGGADGCCRCSLSSTSVCAAV